MLRPKSNSVCLPNKNKSKKHCIQDLACFHCCKCWITHKKQCEIRTKTYNDNLVQLQTQNNLLKQSIQKLLRELLHIKKSNKQKQNIDDLKQRMKVDLMKQLDQQTKMNDLIQKQKIQSLIESLKRQKQQNERINQKIKQQLLEMGEFSLKNKQLSNRIIELQEAVKKTQQAQQKVKQLQDEIKIIKKKQSTFIQDIKRKNQLIDRLQIQLKESEKVINTKTSLQSEYEFQEKKLNFNLKQKQIQIQNLKKTTETQMKGLSLLQFQNCKLNSLMFELDNELLQKQVQSNHLKRSLYDAQNLAWHKETKLQMLKSDIQELKYRL